MNSTQKRDCYEILGLEKNASTDEIKKAYKKLAVKWHPDKNSENKEEATEKFREISEAYQILSDEEKKKKYDMYGYDGPKSSSYSGYKFTDANDIFNMFFKNSGFGGGSYFKTSTTSTTAGSNRGQTYYKFSDGSSGYSTSQPTNSATYQKYADILRGKAPDTSSTGGYTSSRYTNGTGTYTTSDSSYSRYFNQNAGTSQKSEEKSDKEETKLPPKGHAMKQVHHVIRQTSDGKQSTIKRTTMTYHDGSKQITEENLDGTNKKVYHVLGGGQKKEEKSDDTPTTSANFSGFNFNKRQTTTENTDGNAKENTNENTESKPAEETTSKPSNTYQYTTKKVYYADGTEAPVSSTSFGSYGSYGYKTSNPTVTRRTVYTFK